MNKKQYTRELLMFDRAIDHARQRAYELSKSDDSGTNEGVKAYRESIEENQNFKKTTRTDYLISLADRKHLLTPPENNSKYWEELPPIPPVLGGRRVLTSQGHAYIWRDLRELKRKTLMTWTAILTACTGVIGTLIGLLSILLKN